MGYSRESAYLVLLACVASALVLVVPDHVLPIASAAEYPAKPVKLVVGGPAGGAADVVPRQVAELLAARLKQPVVIENRPGASGAIAAKLVAKAPPRWVHVAVLYNSATHGGSAVMFPDLGYDPVKDLAPIVRMATVPFVLIVNPGLKAHSVNNLIELAKAEPGKLRFGFGGKGGLNYIVGELLKHQAEIQFVPVAYKGLNEVVTDVAGGHIDLGFATPGDGTQ